MKLRYFSDLHLEFIDPRSIHNFIKDISPGLDEICILAGDIGYPQQPNYDTFMNFVSANFKKAFVIAGNHEYYNKSKNVDEMNRHLSDYFKKFNNITFLHNSFEYYEGACFIGTTLWSKITNPSIVINDVYRIPSFDYEECNQYHEECVDFLERTLQTNEKCIVITHHLPSEKLIDVKYTTPQMVPYNQWFCSDINTLIQRNQTKIKCWFYGHTHTPSESTLYDIPFLCNPIGYPNENKHLNFQTIYSIHI